VRGLCSLQCASNLLIPCLLYSHVLTLIPTFSLSDPSILRTIITPNFMLALRTLIAKIQILITSTDRAKSPNTLLTTNRHGKDTRERKCREKDDRRMQGSGMKTTRRQQIQDHSQNPNSGAIDTMCLKAVSERKYGRTCKFVQPIPVNKSIPRA
jgi:hypothetical protein